MSDFNQEIDSLKEDLDKAKNKRYRAEARMEELKKNKQKILAELEDLGVAPEELEDKIASLETELEELIAEAKELLPQDILND
ncbi:hypothetical protein [Fuchsiella alkaliacetigena]|uniref:hypothetical protein n=1 Tax=Fuchsiella alkaliacetigena TaxID=957042 RepID=UPI00200AE579|nr:hypothetical protein [Fuchsiella alkaliacetigena]MCK8824259.1 hypothetical protein [Fuchsiella alkaliacetigena]